MKVSDLVNVLQHFPGDLETEADITFNFTDGHILASQVLANLQAGKPLLDGAVTDATPTT